MKPAILITVVGLATLTVAQSAPKQDSTSDCPVGKYWVYTAQGRTCADGKDLNLPPESPQTKTEDSKLSPLPNIGELEKAAATLRITPAKCEADARAYSDSPTAELISSISDVRVHELNVEALACMKSGGTTVRYGYLLKTVVDAAYTAHTLVVTRQGDKKDKAAFAQVADKEVHRLLDQYNELVGKYNDLVGRYNSLLGSTQAVEVYAEQLRRNNDQLLTLAALSVGASSVSRYSMPQQMTMPSTIYLRQSPLSCTTQNMPAAVPGLPSWSYTHCY